VVVPVSSAATVRFSCRLCDWSYELPNRSYGLLESAYANHVTVRHFPKAIIVWSQDAAQSDGEDAP
jgi:hypothetical protein